MWHSGWDWKNDRDHRWGLMAKKEIAHLLEVQKKTRDKLCPHVHS